MIRIAMLALLSVLSLASSVHAGFCRGCHQRQCCEAPCSYQTVERTVLVPEYYRELRPVQFTEYRPQPYERVYTVLKPIPETHKEMRQFVKYVPKTTMRTEHYTVCRPVYRTVTQQCTVMVPRQETVPACNSKCGGCGHCECCTVTVCRPEVRTRNIQVCEYVYDHKTRDVPCVEMVREVSQKEVTLTRMRYEPEQKKMTCMRMTPVPVERMIEVPACRMVEKKITCRVPVYGSCAN